MPCVRRALGRPQGPHVGQQHALGINLGLSDPPPFVGEPHQATFLPAG